MLQNKNCWKLRRTSHIRSNRGAVCRKKLVQLHCDVKRCRTPLLPAAITLYSDSPLCSVASVFTCNGPTAQLNFLFVLFLTAYICGSLYTVYLTACVSFVHVSISCCLMTKWVFICHLTGTGKSWGCLFQQFVVCTARFPLRCRITYYLILASWKPDDGWCHVFPKAAGDFIIVTELTLIFWLRHTIKVLFTQGHNTHTHTLLVTLIVSMHHSFTVSNKVIDNPFHHRDCLSLRNTCKRIKTPVFQCVFPCAN